MKKFLKILTCAAILISGLALTACGVKEIVKESVDSSYKQWYKYNNSKQIEIPLVLNNASDTNTANESNEKLKNAEIYLYFDPDVGMKVAIQSVVTQEVSFFNGAFSQQMNVTYGGTKQYTLQEFGKIKWAALWGSGKIEKTSAPKIITAPGECVLLDGENRPTIQWRRFLANYLLDKLLEE